MFLKSAAFVVFLVALGAATLSLRQQKWDSSNATAVIHRQMERSRRTHWEHEVKVTALLKPAALEHKIAVAQLDLEPVAGALPKPPAPTRVATQRTPANRNSSTTRNASHGKSRR